MSLYSVPAEVDQSWLVSAVPTTEPVTLDEVKGFAKVDGVAEDSFLEYLLQSVREAVESYLGRSLIPQTIVLSMDGWPGEAVNLPRPPLISVTEVRTVDQDGTAAVYASSNYYLIRGNDYAQVVLKTGIAWPINTIRAYKGYEIQYQAGYADAASVPAAIKMGIMLWFARAYEARAFDLSAPPKESLTLLEPYRIVRA